MDIAARLAELRGQALGQLAQAGSTADLEQWRVQYLGRRSALNDVLRQLGSLSAEERPTATVRVLPDTAPSQLLDEIIAEEAETPTAQIGPSRPGVPLMSAEDDEPPTPDMRDFAREARKLDEDVTRNFRLREPRQP